MSREPYYPPLCAPTGCVSLSNTKSKPSMKWVPANNNISHSDFDDYSWWAKKQVEDLVLRYYSQDGIDKTGLEPYMMERFKKVLKELGPEFEKMHNKAFKIK